MPRAEPGEAFPAAPSRDDHRQEERGAGHPEHVRDRDSTEEVGQGEQEDRSDESPRHSGVGE